MSIQLIFIQYSNVYIEKKNEHAIFVLIVIYVPMRFVLTISTIIMKLENLIFLLKFKLIQEIKNINKFLVKCYLNT